MVPSPQRRPAPIPAGSRAAPRRQDRPLPPTWRRSFLVFTLLNYSERETSVQKRGRKLYVVNGAIRNAALQRGLAPLDNPEEQGALVENLVAATLRSLALDTGSRLYHWRDGRHELDDLVLDPSRPTARLEIASSPQHSRTSLQAFAERHPRFRRGTYLVAPQAAVIHPEATQVESAPFRWTCYSYSPGPKPKLPSHPASGSAPHLLPQTQLSLLGPRPPARALLAAHLERSRQDRVTAALSRRGPALQGVDRQPPQARVGHPRDAGRLQTGR